MYAFRSQAGPKIIRGPVPGLFRKHPFSRYRSVQGRQPSPGHLQAPDPNAIKRLSVNVRFAERHTRKNWTTSRQEPELRIQPLP